MGKKTFGRAPSGLSVLLGNLLVQKGRKGSQFAPRRQSSNNTRIPATSSGVMVILFVLACLIQMSQ
jgi:hypothetical protein